jgi:hypothetical protein
MTPIQKIIDIHMFEVWDGITINSIKSQILALGIPGLVDVRVNVDYGYSNCVTPVFATEQDYTWYQLKYNDHSL